MNRDLHEHEGVPFDDPRGRQALRLAIDREQALTACTSGHGVVANDLPEPFAPGYPRSLVRRRDVARARQLLKEAGKEGVTVELVTGPVSPEAVPMCTVLAKDAAEIGMTGKVRQVDTATLFGNAHRAGLPGLRLTRGGGRGPAVARVSGRAPG